MASARSVALDSLCAFESRGYWSARRLDALIDDARLDRRDAAFCTFLANGVVQNLYLLDYHLTKLSKIPPKKLETRVLCLLRLGMFQLFFADGVPQSAAVNETVKLVRDRRTRGFINAVLRTATRRNAFDIDIADPIERASVLYSVPTETVRELYEILGADDAERELATLNMPPPVTIRVNTRYFDAIAVREMLIADGVTVEDGPLPETFYLGDTGSIQALNAFKVGAFWVQDAAAMCAVEALQITESDSVLDLCAAPGGKSFYAALTATSVTACDISERKVEGIKADAGRLRLAVHLQVSDATIDRPEFRGKFDRIIADLPCSGLGTIRKKPDIRFKRLLTRGEPLQSDLADLAATRAMPLQQEVAAGGSPLQQNEAAMGESFQQTATSDTSLQQNSATGDAPLQQIATSNLPLPSLQAMILDRAASYLKPGGRLLYSTCTWRREENEEVVADFLSRHPNFRLMPFEIDYCNIGKTVGMTQLWTHRNRTDGFFVCVLERKDVL